MILPWSSPFNFARWTDLIFFTKHTKISLSKIVFSRQAQQVDQELVRLRMLERLKKVQVFQIK
jgi:hypothetical protein